MTERLIATIPWRHHEIRLFGRRMRVPRLSSWHGEAPYSYSGLMLLPESWTPDLYFVKSRIERITGHLFNSVLLNLYRDGRDSMGWHSDDEPELGRNPVIASVSLGAIRRLRMRSRHDKTRAFSAELPNGSLLLMAGPTQHNWQHMISKTTRATGARVNLTFRWTHLPESVSLPPKQR